MEVDPKTIAYFKRIETLYEEGMIQSFERLFVYPGAARHASKYLQKFVAIDATFTPNRFIQ